MKDHYKSGELNTEGGRNTFKFKSFSDRVASIDITSAVFHKTNENAELEPYEGYGSFFQQYLREWEDLNRTGHFLDFVQEVRPYTDTLVLLLYHKEKVVDILIKHLQVPNSLAYKPLLNLSCILSRDLRDAFYEYFPRLFKTIVDLIDPLDPDLLEDIFTALSFFFKFLQKQLLNDLPNVFDYYKALLYHRKEFVAHFAAESFAFLIRKLHSTLLAKHFEVMLQCIHQENQFGRKDDFMTGLSFLFFEVIRGITHQFHSRAELSLDNLFKCTAWVDSANRSIDTLAFFEHQKDRYQVIGKTIELACEHTVKEHATPVWNAIIKYTKQLVAFHASTIDSKDGSNQYAVLQLKEMVGILNRWASYRSGSRICDIAQLVGILKLLISKQILTTRRFDNNNEVSDVVPQYTDSVATLLLTVIDFISSEENVAGNFQSDIHSILDVLYSTQDSYSLSDSHAETVLRFSQEAATFSLFSSYVFIKIAKYCNDTVEKLPQRALHFISTFYGNAGNELNTHLNKIPQCTRVESYLLDVISTYQEQKGTDKKSTPKSKKQAEKPTVSSSVVWRALYCMAHIQLNYANAAQRLESFLKFILPSTEPEGIVLLFQALNTFTSVMCIHSPQKLVEYSSTVLQLLQQHKSNVRAILTVVEYLRTLKKIAKDDPVWDQKNLGILMSELKYNLASPIADLRRYTTEILSMFKQYDLLNTSQKSSSSVKDIPEERKQCTVFDTFNTVLNVPLNPMAGKEISHLFYDVERLLNMRVIPSQYVTAITCFLLGSYHVKFSMIWGAAEKALSAAAEADFKLFWDGFYYHLQKVTAKASMFKVQPQDEKEPEKIQEPIERDFQKELQFAVTGGDSKSYTDPMVVYERTVHSLVPIAHLVEKNPEDVSFVVDYFLDFVNNEYDVVFQEKARPASSLVGHHKKSELSTKKANNKLMPHLELFSKFVNPQKLPKAQELYAVFNKLLLKSNPEVQKAAFDCVATWKEPFLLPFKDSLIRIIQEESFKHELFGFDVETINAKLENEENVIGETQAKTEMKSLFKLMSKILFGKMLKRQGGTNLGNRRHNVMIFIGRFHHMLLETFLEMIMEPLLPFLNKTSLKIEELPPATKILGFLNLLREILLKFGSHVEKYLPPILSLVILLLRESVKWTTSSDMVLSSLHSKDILLEIRNLALKRYKEFAEQFPESKEFQTSMQQFFTAVKPLLDKFHSEHAQQTSSSNFFDTIITFTKHHTLAPCIPDGVTATVFSSLGLRSVSQRAIQDILTYVQNFLDIEQNYPGISILKQTDIDILLLHLPNLIQLNSHGKVSYRQLQVLSTLSRYVQTAEQARLLLETIVPLIERRIGQEGTHSSGITNISDMQVKMLGVVNDAVKIIEEPRKYVLFVSQLFGTMKPRACRTEVSAIMATLGSLIPQLKPIIAVIQDLNSWSTQRLDEYDFDKRLAAFSSLSEKIESFSYIQLLPVVFNLVNFVDDEDISIRNHASNCLTALVKRVSGMSQGKIQQFLEKEKTVFSTHFSCDFFDTVPTDTSDSVDNFLNLITKIVYPCIGRGMASTNPLVRREFVLLLGLIVVSFPTLYPDLYLLHKEDQDKDFYAGISHGQVFRKAIALKLFRKHCTANAFHEVGFEKYVLTKQKTLRKLFVPMFRHLLSETTAKEHNFLDALMLTLGCIAQKLPWLHYASLLQSFLRDFRMKPNLEKILVKVICAVLDNFHFDLQHTVTQQELEDVRMDRLGDAASAEIDGEAEEQEEEDEEASQEDEEEQDEEEDENNKKKGKKEEKPKTTKPNDVEDPMDVEPAAFDANSTGKIIDTLKKTIIPNFFGLLQPKKAEEGKKPEPIRIVVAVALVKILKLMPQDYLDYKLPQLVLIICKNLVDRELSVRDATRQALHAVARTLGPYYIKFILQEMCAALVKGYQVHVLGYSVGTLLQQFVLQGTVQPSSEEAFDAPVPLEPGALDPSIEILLKIFLEDLFGDISDQKEGDSGFSRGLKEARANKSFESFEMLSRAITFPSKFDVLLDTLTELADKTDNLKDLQKIEEILRRIAAGIANNPTVNVKELLIFIYKIIKTNTERQPPQKQDAKKRKRTKEDTFGVAPSPRQVKSGGAKDLLFVNAHLFIEMGLNLMLAFHKRDKFSGKDVEQLQMLDPYVSILTDCLDSKYPRIVSLSLKNMCALLKFPLPAIAEHVQTLSEKCLELVEEESSDQIKTPAMRLITTLVRDYEQVGITKTQLAKVTSMIKNDLDDLKHLNTTFTLLKRKIVTPSVYDIMTRIGELLVRSELLNIRQTCAQLTIQFLLHYPMADKRHKDHLQFLLTNLSYKLPDGRMSVLEALQMVIAKFPEEAVEANAEFLFLPLVLRLINDDNPQCRKAVAEVIKSLLKVVKPGKLDALFKLAVTWMAPQNQKNAKAKQLTRASVQVLGFFVEVAGADVVQKIFAAELFAKVIQLIQKEIHQMYDEDPRLSAEGNDGEAFMSGQDQSVDISICYFALNLMEKIFGTSPQYILSEDCDALWPLVEELLNHPHTWVRTVSSRLIGIYLNQFKLEGLMQILSSNSGKGFMQPQTVFTLVKQFCRQLGANYITAPLGEQAVKNLLFITVALYKVSSMSTMTSDQQPTSNNNDEADDDEEHDQEQKSDPKEPEDQIHWLFRRLSFLAKETNDLRKLFIFRFFAAIATQMNTFALRSVLTPILYPIAAVAEVIDRKLAQVPEELANVVQESMELLQKLVGVEPFLNVLNTIRSKRRAVRQERKRKKAIMTAIDPEQAVKKKHMKRLKDKLVKKRRIMEKKEQGTHKKKDPMML